MSSPSRQRPTCSEPPRAFYEQVLGLPVADHDNFAYVLDTNGAMLRIP